MEVKESNFWCWRSCLMGDESCWERNASIWFLLSSHKSETTFSFQCLRRATRSTPPRCKLKLNGDEDVVGGSKGCHSVRYAELGIVCLRMTEASMCGWRHRRLKINSTKSIWDSRVADFSQSSSVRQRESNNAVLPIRRS